jgi:signal transduction histidine kinase
MSAIASSRPRIVVATIWAVFAVLAMALMFAMPERETIPYHLLWASFALLYGLWRWPRVLSRSVFLAIVAITGTALIKHAAASLIDWEECTEIVLMALIIAVVMWHVDRNWTIQDHLVATREAERQRAQQRDTAARFGSHEVRTRLTIARGYAEIIADTATAPQVRADARVILEELDKASTIATRILTLVRFVGPPHGRTLDADALIAAVVRRWSVTAPRQWLLRCDVGVIQADPERVETLLDCLLENAMKFTTAGDVISVDADVVGSVIRLVVQDEGSGILPSDIDRIFELFATGASAGSRAGSGIGLPIVKAIVDTRGGTVDVTSTPGEGTCFTVLLPLLSVPMPVGTDDPASRPDMAGRPGKPADSRRRDSAQCGPETHAGRPSQPASCPSRTTAADRL